jgi:hypothetical protein
MRLVYVHEQFGELQIVSSPEYAGDRRASRSRTGRARWQRASVVGLNAPPPGYHSAYGVRRSQFVKSQFDDNEYVIYDEKQQRLEYLVEFTA